MKLSRRNLLALIWASLLPSLSAQEAAKLTGKEIIYEDGDTTLVGYLVMPQMPEGTTVAPGVMVVHDWTGVQDYAKTRATQLATELHVAAFCCDIYGKGVRPTDPKACGAEAGKYKQDRAVYRRRLTLGLQTFLAQEGVDKTQIAAIGYCFGGTGVLELARTGADVKGVVSFHGGLDSPTPEDGAKIKSSVLILHGADDPFVPQKDIDACLKEFNAAKVDWQMVSYSGAVHSFTKPDAGNDSSKGAAYNETADKRSWQAMRSFLGEKLKLPQLSRRRVVLPANQTKIR